MFTIDFSDHTGLVETSWFDQIDQLLTFAKKKENIHNDAELSVTFVDKDEIQNINKVYRDKDKVTDVISFALEEDEPEIDFNDFDIPRVLGDIIYVQMLPKNNQKATDTHLSVNWDFSITWLLHLLGYDHMNDNDEKEMFGRQDAILNEFGLTRN